MRSPNSFHIILHFTHQVKEKTSTWINSGWMVALKIHLTSLGYRFVSINIEGYKRLDDQKKWLVLLRGLH